MRLFTVVFQQCELGLPLILALWYHLEKWVRRVVILLFFVALSSVAYRVVMSSACYFANTFMPETDVKLL